MSFCWQSGVYNNHITGYRYRVRWRTSNSWASSLITFTRTFVWPTSSHLHLLAHWTAPSLVIGQTFGRHSLTFGTNLPAYTVLYTVKLSCKDIRMYLLRVNGGRGGVSKVFSRLKFYGKESRRKRKTNLQKTIVKETRPTVLQCPSLVGNR